MYPLQDTFRKDALARLNSRVKGAHQVAGNMLEMTREIGELNLRTTKASADALSRVARQMLEAANPVEFFTLAASAWRPDLGGLRAYAQELSAITSKLITPVAAGQAVLEAASAAAPAVPEEALAAAVLEQPEPAAAPAGLVADPLAAGSLVLDEKAGMPAISLPADEPKPAPEAAAAAAPAIPATPAAPAATPAAKDEAPVPLQELVEPVIAAVTQASTPAEKVPKKPVSSPAVLASSVAAGKGKDAKKVQYKTSLPGKSVPVRDTRNIPQNAAKAKKS